MKLKVGDRAAEVDPTVESPFQHLPHKADKVRNVYTYDRTVNKDYRQ